MPDAVPRHPASKRQRVCGGVFCALAMAASVLFALQVRKDILAAFVDFDVEIPNGLSLSLNALPLLALLVEAAIFTGLFLRRKQTLLPCLLLFLLTLIGGAFAANVFDLDDCDLPWVFCQRMG
jgi:hypothetical protein